MACNFALRPRSNLTSDRERQPRLRERARDEVFGVYVALSDVSRKKIMKAHVDASVDVATYFNATRKQAASIAIPEATGFTYIQKNNVARQLPHAISRGFQIERFKQFMIREGLAEESRIEVPISNAFWDRNGRRKLAFLFEMASSEAMELAEQAETLETCVNKARGNGIKVETPDHVTLFEYGSPDDGLEMGRRQRSVVKAIYEHHFEAHDIDSLLFQGLIVGDKNSQPLTTELLAA